MTKIPDSKKQRKHMADPQLNDNDMEDNISIAIKEQKENWSEYELEDGSKLRIKPLVMGVHKSRLPAPDGNQQYHIRSTIIIDVQTPPKPSKLKNKV